ncbi:MAG: hypothetical protein ABSE73_33225, partial [Planctomycetota bacterium]
ANQGQDLSALQTLRDYVAAFKYPIEGLPDDLRQKIAAAAPAVLNKIFAAQGVEEALSLYAPLSGAPTRELLASRDNLVLSAAQLYDRYHETVLARQYYELLVAASADARLQEQAKNAIAALDANTAKFQTQAALPVLIQKDVRFKELPVPYNIADKVLVLPHVKVIFEKGAHIKGGRIELQNATMEFQGTADAPVILQDVQLGNQPDRSHSSYTGTHVILVRAKLAHFGGHIETHQQRWAFFQSHLIGMDIDCTGWLTYDLSNCTLRKCQLNFDGVLAGFNALSLFDCQVGAPGLFSITGSNLNHCRMGGDKREIKQDKPVSQRALWLDPDSEASTRDWARLIRFTSDSKGKLEFVPAISSVPNCGANWPCPMFAPPLLLPRK